ncbi:peroxide stress protein YaaA [Paenimyroides ceti]
MKILISPAKSLDFESTLPTQEFTKIKFIKESKTIHTALKEKTPKELSDLMAISDKLGELNWQRNQERKYRFTQTGATVRQAVYAFNGDVYTGLDAYTLPLNKIDFLQENVRILSGLYGLLKPLDLIEPYRLEMGTKLPVGTSKNLYDFWKPALVKELNAQMKRGEDLINLASKEYFSAVDTKLLKHNVITPEFMEYKDGKLKIISFFAKKARGLMVRYIIDHSIDKAEDIKSFNIEGYRFDSALSTENKWVFTR